MYGGGTKHSGVWSPSPRVTSYIMYNIARAGDGAVPRPRRCQFPMFVGDAVLVPALFKMALCPRCWLHDFSIASADTGSGLKFCCTHLRVS